MTDTIPTTRRTNRRLAEIAYLNADTFLDGATDLVRAQSLSELIDVSNANARRRIEMGFKMTRELVGLVQQTASETAIPLAQGFAEAVKSFDRRKAA